MCPGSRGIVASNNLFEPFNTLATPCGRTLSNARITECHNAAGESLSSHPNSDHSHFSHQFGAKPCTVKEAIGKLPKVVAGQAHKSDSLHRASKLSAINKRRISASLQSGTWRDWPDDLILPCHRRATGEGYPSVYGRMAWSDRSPTITTLAYNYGSGRFGHPTQDRAITLREAALLQAFPGKYSFVRPNERLNIRIVGRLIGNAVPVVLARVIGRSIIGHLASLQSNGGANSTSRPERRHVSKRR